MEQNSKSLELLLALVDEIPEMGQLEIEADDNQLDLLWHWFRVSTDRHLAPGLYIYRYEMEEDSALNKCGFDAKFLTCDNSVVYLYKVK